MNENTLGKPKKPTQKDKVFTLLKGRGAEGMSAIDMLRFGVYRAAARVAELREEGWDIETINEHGKTAVYVLKGKKQELVPMVPIGGQAELWKSFGGDQ